MPREIVSLECSICKRRNYTGTVNRSKKKEKLKLKKYCPFDKKHTEHREVK